MQDNVFTLIRYDRFTGLEHSRIEIAEPEKFKDMKESVQRDKNGKHGVFFNYSTDLVFYNSVHKDSVTGVKFNSNAYDFIKAAYDQDFSSAVLQLTIAYKGSIDFDLYADFKDCNDDKYNKLFTLKFASRQPFLLKESQEQKVDIALNPARLSTINMRQTTIIRRNKARINQDLFLLDDDDLQPLGFSFTPPFYWQDEEFPGSRYTETFETTEHLFLDNARGDFDYKNRYVFVIEAIHDSAVFSSNVSIDVVFEVRNLKDEVVHSNNQTIPGVLAATISILGAFNYYYSFELDQTGSFLSESVNKLFVSFTVQNPPNVNFGWSVVFFRDDLQYWQGNTALQTLYNTLSQREDSFIQLDWNEKLFSTTCEGAMLKDCFQEVLNFNGLTLQSSILDDVQKLGSMFMTTGRRIARSTEANQMSISFKTLFEEWQKLQNLGYSLEGNVLIIEEATYFYDDSQIFELNEVSKFDEDPNDDFNYNIMKVGFSTYKEDGLGVLYENESFNSQREYNLEASKYSKTLNLVCSFVMSNFIIEKYRRDADKENDDKFVVIALNRSELVDSTFYTIDGTAATHPVNTVAEGFEAYDNPTNDYGGLDETSLINFRYTPARIARNWLNIFKTSLYKLTAGEKIAKFIDGQPKFNMTVDNVQENSDIALTSIQEIFKPITYKLETYLSRDQYKDLKSKKTNLIRLTFEGATYEGYLLDMEYNFNEQIVSIDLIPKADTI